MLLSPLMPLREKGSAASLAAEFNAAATSPNSWRTQLHHAREGRDHFDDSLPAKKQARSVRCRRFTTEGFFNWESCLLRVSSEAAAFSKNSAGATFCIHHFGAAEESRDTRAPKS